VPRPLPKPQKREKPKPWQKSQPSKITRLSDAPSQWIEFQQSYDRICGTLPKSSPERWDKLVGVSGRYSMEEIGKRLEVWRRKRTDRDMSWAVDDFLGGEVDSVDPEEQEFAFPKAEAHPL